MRDSVVFYRSFWEAIKRLPESDRLAALTAVIEYGLDGVEPEPCGVAAAIYIMAKPQIDANNKRYINGKKGGRPEKDNQQETQKEPKENQTETKHEPKEKEKENVNVKEKEKQIMCDAAALFERLWKLYPCKKGKGQVSDTQKKRLLAIGEPALVKAIERYSSELQKDAGWRKPQNGSTFFNSGYVDYLDGNFVPDKIAEKKDSESKSRNRFHNFESHDYDYESIVREINDGGMT